MIAFAWRQFRTQGVIAAAGLVVLGLVLLVTGPNLVHVFDSATAQCRAGGGPALGCNNPVTGTDAKLQVVASFLVLVVPVLVGMFWGAPLVAREFETGTFRLAWTQSVSRRRWLVVKLALVGLASAVTGALLSLMVTWWYSPIDKVNQNRFGPAAFGMHGFVPAGYALFAFALGATAGLLIRRTLPAMVVTLVGFIVARWTVAFWVRPHFAAPATMSQSLAGGQGGFGFNLTPAGIQVTSSPPNLPNAWALSSSIVDTAGRAPTSAEIQRACPGLPGVTAPAQQTPPHGAAGVAHAALPDVQASMQRCITTLSTKYHAVVTYQPANRFWAFQTYETLLFVAASAVLAGACVWWIRHRLR